MKNMHDIKLKQSHNENLVSQFLNHESPAKVFSLMGTALFSMAFCLMVSVTNASFEGTREAIPEPFSEQNVISFLDNTASSYSKFVDFALLKPMNEDLAFYKDVVNWAVENDTDVAIVNALGLESLAQVDAGGVVKSGKVAGAFVSNSNQPSLLDSLYYLLSKK
jgi:hypothetical protein